MKIFNNQLSHKKSSFMAFSISQVLRQSWIFNEIRRLFTRKSLTY